MYHLSPYRFLGILIIILLGYDVPVSAQPAPLFKLMDAASTGIQFINTVTESEKLHIFKYEYLYNGHGIGVADFDKDGMADVFIAGNEVPNKLYKNNGHFSFSDITLPAGVTGNGYWRTGVSIADVNGDGWPDIYVCHSGPYSGDSVSNELFIHQGLQNGLPVFKEMAKAYGLDAPGTLSTQAAFFDYDQDGDLDMFLVNHSNHTFNPYLNTRRQRATPDLRFGNRLFRNDASKATEQPTFTDVTLQAGIINNALNFGLSVIVSDLNLDGWPDLYTSSDYTEQDYCYLNNKNGTFTQVLQQSFHYISKFSMGADIADINNDGWPDVFTLDMLPEDNYRQKLLKGPDEYDAYHLLLDSGYYRQHMRNMLHLHQGLTPAGVMKFAEIGQMAGISNTDWSWSALLADYDNDGYKDLFVTNGYLRDYTDNDFLKYTVADEQLTQAAKGNLNFKSYNLVKKMPSNKLSNYAFKNNGNCTYTNTTRLWGLQMPTVSNAAVYVDLDNDGDLDLIIGNNNEPVQVYQNQARQQDPRVNYLQIQLTGNTLNTAALGTRIQLITDTLQQWLECYPVKGYQSSIAAAWHFGIGQYKKVDTLKVVWPGGGTSVLTNVQANQTLALMQPNSDKPAMQPLWQSAESPWLTDITAKSGLPFNHTENDFVDFKVEVLMPYQLSRMGPALAAADINGDGLDDIYVGGAIEQAGAIFLQQPNGTFKQVPQPAIQMHRASEDVRAAFFDADNDGDADLLVISGGNEYDDGAPEYADRLYLNDGKGNFSYVDAFKYQQPSPKLAVAVADIDGDGDVDVFIGGHAQPGNFPNAGRSYLWRNDSKPGSVAFTDVTASYNPSLLKPGMVNAAVFTSLSKNEKPSLIMAGDWMPIELYKNKGNAFEKSTIGSSGLWSALSVQDINNDDLPDLLAGNAGVNLQFKANEQEPISLFVTDIDGDGLNDPLFCYYIQGKNYPAASRDELLDQVVPLRKKFVKYSQYAGAGLEQMVPAAKLRTATVLSATELQHLALIQQPGGSFRSQPLPMETQVSRIFSFVPLQDTMSHQYYLALGNFYPWRVQWGPSMSSYGTLLQQKDKGYLQAVPNQQTGVYLEGDIRQALVLKAGAGRQVLVVAPNNAPIQVWQWHK